jgi:hypothetical protein
LIHVTNCLGPLSDYITEEALHRGKYIHAVTAILDRGRTLAEPIYEPWRGYVDAWEACKCDLGIEIVAVEEPIKDERRGYCGTRDRRVTRKGRRGRQGVLDLKLCASGNGIVPWSVGLQTAAYVGEEKLWRGAVALHGDGTYRWHDDQTSPEIFKATDYREFLARLFVLQSDIARGLREMPPARKE